MEDIIEKINELEKMLLSCNLTESEVGEVQNRVDTLGSIVYQKYGDDIDDSDMELKEESKIINFQKFNEQYTRNNF